VNVAINLAGTISLSRLHIHVFDDGMSVLVIFELHKTNSVRPWKKRNRLRAGIEINPINFDDGNIGVGDISAYAFVRRQDCDSLPRKLWSLIGLKWLRLAAAQDTRQDGNQTETRDRFDFVDSHLCLIGYPRCEGCISGPDTAAYRTPIRSSIVN
jgi:hypothetical protein